jgi:hypothetical protein
MKMAKGSTLGIHALLYHAVLIAVSAQGIFKLRKCCEEEAGRVMSDE